MTTFKDQLFALQDATKNQNFHNQLRIVSQILFVIEKSHNRERVIKEYLNVNLAAAITDVICTRLIILQPSMEIIRHLMTDYHFRSYYFLPIFKNILRVLVLLVRSDEVEKSQLEFFDITAILDVLIKKFLAKKYTKPPDEDMQTTFVCLLTFIEMVLSHNGVEVALKNLMVEIYFHLLDIDVTFKCVCGKFMLIMRVANMADEFLSQFVAEYDKYGNELWLFKMLQILLRIFESFILNADRLVLVKVRVFENIFSGHMLFVLEKLTSTAHNPELFKLWISVLNTVLWTPGFSKDFASKILRDFVKLNGDPIVFCLCKSSKKLLQQTTYTMKIFLTALIVQSSKPPSDKHRILNTFIQCPLSSSLIELKAHQIIRSSKALILLYGCGFLRQRFCNPLSANRVLENVILILNHFTDQLEDDEVWIVLSIFSYCANYASLSTLEYAGVQKTTETLLERAAKIIFGVQKKYVIDKYVISLANEFSTNNGTLNSLIYLYLSQQPDLTSSKVGQIIPSHTVLPLLISSDANQVENALKILQRKQLTNDDMNFVVEQCFASLKVQEINIGAALSLFGTNVSIISDETANKIYNGTIGFLVAKQVELKYSEQCYLCIVKTCVDLIKFKSKVKSMKDIS